MFSEKSFINGPPIIKTTVNDVTTDNPVLNVKYLNTFKNEYWSIKETNKLNNTYNPFIIFLLKSFNPVALDPLIIR